MRRTLLCVLLSLVLCAAAPLSFAEERAVSGFVMEVQNFAEMEQRFRERGFSGDVSSVALSYTQTFALAIEEAVRLMPDVSLQMQEAAELVEDTDQMVSAVQYLLEVALLLQENFPDVFVFNMEMAQAHAETGFGYAIAEPELWLWAANAQGVMLPIYFHDETTGELVDGVYLLNVINSANGGVYYALYNDVETVVEYLMSVELNSGSSLFQQTVIQWYIDNFVEQGTSEAEGGNAPDAGDISETTTPESAKDTDTQDYIGFAKVTASGSANVRKAGNGESEVVGAVIEGSSYKVLSIDENGWYELLLSDGATGFISPKLVKFTER